MSALPKRKLCWNCEGNVAKDIDNCPYCGVYLHAAESEEDDSWNPSYRLSTVQKDSHPFSDEAESSEDLESEDAPQPSLFSWIALWAQFRQDVLPILLLMTGSLFFLFGTILFLFGTLTLQWKAEYWVYFLPLGLLSFSFGWKFLQQDNEEN